MKPKVKPKNPLLFVFEPLEDDPRFFIRKLFSFDAAHLDNRIYLAVSGGEEPWNGLMVCTALSPVPTSALSKVSPTPARLAAG